MHVQFKDLVYSCILSITIFYGSCSIFAEVLGTILPWGLIFIVLLVSVGYFLRLPSPSQDRVDTILGKDPFIEEPDGGYVMKSVAHRGAGLDAPENSLAAFKMCNDNGNVAIEFDIMMTKDEVPIVFHDQSLERMTDLNLVIADHAWSELSTVDISVKHLFKDRFAKTNIPTLEQTVMQLLASGQRMFIDIKDNNTKFVKIIHDLFQRYPNLYTKAVVSSFFPNVIYLIRKGDPKIVCSLAWRPHCFTYESYSFPQGKGERKSKRWFMHIFLEFCDVLHEWALYKFTYFLLGISIILLHKDAISGTSVLYWRNRGVRVMAWSVNTPVEKQYFARVLKITYLTDTLTGEGTTHSPPL